MALYILAVFGLPVLGIAVLLVMSSECETWMKTLAFGILGAVVTGGVLALGIYTGNLIVDALALVVAGLFLRAGLKGHRRDWTR